MEKRRFAILGFGSRGQLFGDFIAGDDGAELVAVADTAKVCRETARDKFHVPSDAIFDSAESFFAKGKIADALFICTQDKDHRAHAVRAMQLGYDICLEKPAAANWKDCLKIYAEQQKTGKKVMICHVLRYSHFYRTLKDLLKQGAVGKIVNVGQTEHVAYWHAAHSYVRGAWRNTAQSSPMILAKCCHDLDILFWLIGKPCESVASFGSLLQFRKENAPTGSADYCVDCAVETRRECPYDAYKIYKDIYKSNAPFLGNNSLIRGKASNDVDEILGSRENKFGRCVYHCDNDVVDHQEVMMRFEGGITARLTMTDFTKESHRTIHICGTNGEIEGDMETNLIKVMPFLGETYTIDLTKEFQDFSVHGGGDKLLYRDFCEYLGTDKESETRTTLKDSLLSHYMCFMAEKSRLADGKPQKILF